MPEAAVVVSRRWRRWRGGGVFRGVAFAAAASRPAVSVAAGFVAVAVAGDGVATQ